MQKVSLAFLNWAMPVSVQENKEEISVNPLLPLHGYHEYQQNKIIASALPLNAWGTETIPLPANLIAKIQAKCSRKDLLALTSVNHAAFITRFYNPPLQLLRFHNEKEIKLFLSYCSDTQTEAHELDAEDRQRSNKRLKTLSQDTAKFHLITRTQENLEDIKKLGFTLSDQLTAEQCVPLVKYLVGMEYLTIYVCDKQRFTSLTPLLQSAHHLSLHHLVITGDSAFYSYRNIVTGGIDSCFSKKTEQDFLPDEFSQFKELRSLKLWNLNQVKTLPDSIGNLNKLERCLLQDVKNLEKLPETFGQLKALRRLELATVVSLQYLPDNIGNLDNLETLILNDLPLIQRIPIAIGQFKTLKSLQLIHLPELKNLPNTITSLDKLEHLLLCNVGLDQLPAAIGQLRALRSLGLEYLRFTSLPDELGNLTLEKLLLNDLGDMLSFPPIICRLRALKSLKLIGGAFDTLPDNIGDLDKLEKLHLRYLDIDQLPATIGQLRALRSLKLESLDALTSLPSEIKNLKLKNFLVYGFDNLPEETLRFISQLPGFAAFKPGGTRIVAKD
jgi:Leucine-rich repeat (LRR) protein